MARIEPPFRWPGGKRQSLAAITSTFPTEYGTYYEPFLGGGAVFFHLQPKVAVLSDHNEDLINFFSVVRDTPDEFLLALRTLVQDERTYYSVRRHRPLAVVWRAARTAYLTSLAFNGIYRVNRNARFNVPYGHRPIRNLLTAEHVGELSGALQSASLHAIDFSEAVQPAMAGDLIYFDPPYTVRHDTNGFRRYNENLFRFEDQVRLAKLAVDLRGRGCHVVISNANHESVRELYPGFETINVTRRSSMAADPRRRGAVSELLFVGGGARAAGL